MEEAIYSAGKDLLCKVISKTCKGAQSALEIKSDVQSLEMTKATIKALRSDETKLSGAQREVNQQLSGLVEEIINFLDVREARELRKQVMTRDHSFKWILWLISPSSNPLFSAVGDARQVKALKRKLNQIEKNAQLVSMLVTGSDGVHQPSTPCLETWPPNEITQEIIGRDHDRDMILRNFQESTKRLSVVSVVGIGGIGKTTLAQALFADEWVKSHFDERIWVWVSPSFKLEEVVWKIARSVTNQELSHCEMSKLQRHLVSHFSGRKILLVLDNIWDDDHLCYNWQRLGDLFASVGFKGVVLITTRSNTVARITGTVDPYMLGDLKAEDSWRLFQRHLSMPCLEPRLEEIAREIAQLCGNVPLVICNIGSLLREMRTSISEWSKFRDELARLGCCGRHQSIMHILKFSYDQLPCELKLCVDIFSLFLKGYYYSKCELFYHWRALGYVKPDRKKWWEHTAEQYFLCLKSRGFLIDDGQGDGFSFKVHDVIHDLVTSIASSSCQMVDSDTYNINGEIRHLSFSWKAKFSGEDFLRSSSISKIKNLQSLLVLRHDWGCWWPKLNLKGVSRFQHLKAMSLKRVGLEEVPAKIGELIQLRYLNLSCNKFKKLPNSVKLLVDLLYLNLYSCQRLQTLPKGLSKLVNLEYLDLRYCRDLEELPKGLSNLRKLRFLHLWGCDKLKHMPPGLGNLLDLVRLDWFKVKGQSSSTMKPNVGQLADLNGLNSLTGPFEIVVDGSWSSEEEARAANLQAKENITRLTISFEGGSNRDNEVVLEGLQPHSNLGQLRIEGHRGERLPTWIDGKLYLGNLEYIDISGWKECRHLGCLGRLPCLRHLIIAECENLEYIEREMMMDVGVGDPNHNLNARSSTTPLFPCLEHLTLRRLPKLKGWQRSRGAGPSGNHECLLPSATASAFPKLKGISLDDVGLVVPAEFRRLPSLESLHIRNSKQLKELPEWIDSLTLLKELSIGNCPKMRRMPKEIAKLPSLTSIAIWDSPNLEERCKEATGEDWPLIQHLPRIQIGLPWIPPPSL